MVVAEEGEDLSHVGKSNIRMICLYMVFLTRANQRGGKSNRNRVSAVNTSKAEDFFFTILNKKSK